MDVTVAICTFNRAEKLERTLQSLTALCIPAGVAWEVIVVDNNSTDATGEVARRYETRLPIRCLFEAVPGKSLAANRVLDAASGKLILWIDDDVLVDRLWLAEYLNAASNWPDAAFFGGTVDPWFEGTPPSWMLKNIALLNEPFALTQYSRAIEPLGERAVVGANMATRTEIHRRFRFDVRLGPKGNRAPADIGEETELFARMRNAGFFGLWVGSACVKHVLAAERLTIEYLNHWYAGLGMHVARRAGIRFDVPILFGAPRWAVKKFVILRAKRAILRPTRSARWVKAVREAALMQGYVAEARRSRSPSPGINTAGA